MSFFSVMLMNGLFSIIFWIVICVLLLGIALLIISLVFGIQYHISKKRELTGGVPRKKYKKWVSISTGIPGAIMIGFHIQRPEQAVFCRDQWTEI